MAETYYNILGINENATKEEIKSAYRKLQMKWHPDKNQNSQDAHVMTQKLNDAYETLRDTQKRQEYDLMKNNKNPFMRMNSNMNSMEVPIDDIFNMFFGLPTNMNMQSGFNSGFPPDIRVFHNGTMGFQDSFQKPPSITKTLSVTMEQVLLGAIIPIDIEKWIMENGVKVYELETIYVTIPPGIDENEIILLKNKGNILTEKLKGDIKVIIKIINETKFKRSGLDLILEKNISLKEALCGFSFELKYINGKSYTLNNNKGNIIPPEYKKVYHGMGLLRGEHKGNMIIYFHIDFPDSLTSEQIDKLGEIL
jgi:DnaJ-class molecular chaperone